MKLQTQFAILLAIFCIFFLFLSASILDTSQKAGFIHEQEQIAHSIATNAYDLNYLISDLFFHIGEKRQNIQIESKIASLTGEIDSLVPETPEEQTLKDRVRENLAHFSAIYTQSLASVEKPTQPGRQIDGELVQVAWSRVAVQNQGIIFATSQLSQLLHQKSDQIEQTSRILVLLLMGVFLLILFITYLFFSRQVLASIAEISRGTQIIGSGDLNYVILRQGDNEIGDLSDNFNQMTRNLKMVTTSVEELEEEIAERERVELALRESETRFRSLFESMTNGCAIYEAVDEGQDFIFTDFNKAAEEIEQISRNDLLGRRVTEVFPSVKDFRVFTVFQRVWKTGIPEFFPEAFYEDSRIAGSWRENWVYKTGLGEIVAIYNDISNRKRAEEALRESEERFRIIAMNSPDIISIQNQDLKYEWVINPAIGLTTEEMIGKTDADLTDPVQAKTVMDLKRKVMETGESLYLELPMKDSTGKEFIYEGSYTPKYDSNGTITGVISYFRDITDRTHTEHALRNSEIKFRRLFEAAKDGILIIDYDSGKIINANPFIETLLGYSLHELIGKTVWDIGPIRDIVESKRIFEELKTKDYIRYDDLPLETVTGIVRDVEFVSNVYLVDNEKVIQCNIRDMSDRIQAERALKESEERLRYAIEVGEFGTWTLSLTTGLLVCSPRFNQIFGYENPAFEWTLNIFLDHVVPGDRVSIEQKIQSVLSQVDSLDFECQIAKNNGYDRWVWMKGSPQFDPHNELISISGLIQDITPRKQAAQELETLYTNLEERVRERTHELEEINKVLEEEIIQRTIAEENNLHTLSVLNAIIESTENGILVIDSSGKVTKMNHQFTTMWMISGLNCSFDDCADILGEITHQMKDPEKYHGELQHVLNTSEQDNHSLIELTDNRIFEWHSKPQKIGSDVIGRVWTFRDITRQKEMETLIVKSLREKEILLKEIHHRVKNNMQVISSLLYMQSKITDDEKTKTILIESQNRIKSIALIHESLYQSPNLDNIDYIDYLRKISRYLFESFNISSNRIICKITGEKVYLDIDKAIPCSLILNEMISNSLKYAFPDNQKGTIQIDVRSGTDNVIIIYNDNGVGIPEHITLDNTGTMGLQLINGLTNQLKGTVELEREHGTLYKITFPMTTSRS